MSKTTLTLSGILMLIANVYLIVATATHATTQAYFVGIYALLSAIVLRLGDQE